MSTAPERISAGAICTKTVLLSPSPIKNIIKHEQLTTPCSRSSYCVRTSDTEYHHETPGHLEQAMGSCTFSFSLSR